MPIASGDTERSYELLRSYNGVSTWLHYLREAVMQRNYSLSEFDINYILANHAYTPKFVNRVIGITEMLAEKIQKDHYLDFMPEKIWIGNVIGEMGNSYHCYVQFQKAIPPQLMYVKRRDLKEELFRTNYKAENIDFNAIDAMAKEGRKLRDHQKSAVKFLVSNRKAILADSMGLGKTLSSIAASIAANCQKVLIITTASLKSTWRKELSLYFDDKEIEVVQAGRKFKGGARYTVVNYDLVSNFYEVPQEPVFEKKKVLDANGKPKTVWEPVMVKSKTTGEMVQKTRVSRKQSTIDRCLSESRFVQENFDCVIVDEVQKLSNNKSIRYMTIKDMIGRTHIPYVFLLTGTPLTNKPMNFYHILKLLDAEITDDYRYYVLRYCDGKEITPRATGKKVLLSGGHSNLDELRDKVKHLYMRRLISDLPGMVNKTVSERYYYLSPQQTNQYESLWGDYMACQGQTVRDDGRSPEEWKQLVEGTLVRKFLAAEMVPNTIALVNELLEDEDKVIIVCTYQHELDAFMKYYGSKAVAYDGRMSVKQKDQSEKAFKEDNKVKVFVGNINAASLGLTLTVAKKMVFNSYSWEEIANRQMQDRIWRLTQTEDVECIYQLWTDSISQHMYESVIQKGFIMDSVIKTETEKWNRK